MQFFIAFDVINTHKWNWNEEKWENKWEIGRTLHYCEIMHQHLIVVLIAKIKVCENVIYTQKVYWRDGRKFVKSRWNAKIIFHSHHKARNECRKEFLLWNLKFSCLIFLCLKINLFVIWSINFTPGLLVFFFAWGCYLRWLNFKFFTPLTRLFFVGTRSRLFRCVWENF